MTVYDEDIVERIEQANGVAPSELAERLGYGDVEFVTVTPDDRKEMLLAGQIDLITAC